jgi:hypothetical protein
VGREEVKICGVEGWRIAGLPGPPLPDTPHTNPPAWRGDRELPAPRPPPRRCYRRRSRWVHYWPAASGEGPAGPTAAVISLGRWRTWRSQTKGGWVNNRRGRRFGIRNSGGAGAGVHDACWLWQGMLSRRPPPSRMS